MILGIIVNGKYNCIGIYKDQKNKYEKCWDVVEHCRKDILLEIDNLIKKHKIKLSDLKMIVVYRGPGSLTSVRVGVNTANVLAWSLDISVIGYKGNKKNQKINVFNMIRKTIKNKKINNQKFKFNKPVEPYYLYSLK